MSVPLWLWAAASVGGLITFAGNHFDLTPMWGGPVASFLATIAVWFIANWHRY